MVFVYGLGLLLHSDLQGQSRIEDELSKISFVEQFLKVSLEDVIVHCEMAPPVMEGATFPESRSHAIGWGT